MKVTLKNVRASFLEIWHAKQVNGQGKPSFSATFLLPPDHPQINELEAAAVAVAKAKWAEKSPGIIKAAKGQDKWILHDGDLKSQYAGFEGMLYVNARNAARPLVLDRDKSPLTEQDGRPYSGCYVNAVIELWAQDNEFGKRVNASLAGIQFVKNGDAFAGGGATAKEDDFDDLGDGADEDDLV